MIVRMVVRMIVRIVVSMVARMVARMDPATFSSSPAHDTLDTLDSLAREFQSLPLLALAPAGILFLAGLLLLIAGHHFLRAVLVITIISLGAMLGAPVLGSIAPSLGSVALTVLGGIAGLVIVAATWRLMLGCATGFVLAAACSFIALIGIDAGLVDARSTTDQPPHAITIELQAAHDALVERAPAALAPLVAWADSRWQHESQQVRTFLTASAAGGALVGLVLGTWLPLSSAVILTSMLGALFTLAGGMPLLERALAREPHPTSPLAWILLWAALTLAGWLWQSWRGTPDDLTHAHAQPSKSSHELPIET